MRIALVVHGFPPHECTGVEMHVAALAKRLAQRGVEVEVFAPRRDLSSAEFAQRREARDGFHVTWVVLNRTPQSAEEHLDRPGMAATFGEFLERRRPALVHFQHVIKLGVGLIEETTRRGIPSIYTAHDYFPICHRVILARPDLSRCSTIADSQACARCDAAVSYLNLKQRWSDYHAGVLSESLSSQERRELAALLDDQRTFDLHSKTLNTREKLDRRRQAAFAALDLVLAPTQFLREQLIAGGFDAARVEKSAYGIESEALAKIPSPRADAKSATTFGFIGGASKHKGLHVLLEAFASVKSSARLSIHSDSTDREYVSAMRERARAVGAEWRGAFSAADLPRVLSEIDVLVVPSIWWENAPFVIREAFAAGRPVISSDTPALRESVRDGVDGILVAPGDAKALSEALQRLIDEPRLQATLAGNIRAPRSLDDQCDELSLRYGALISLRQRSVPAQVPASARAFATRVLALEQLTVGELAARALAQLASLATGLALDASLAQAADSRALALEHLHDSRRENAWRARGLEALSASRVSLASELELALADGERAREALAKSQLELRARDAELKAAELSQTATRAELEAQRVAQDVTLAALGRAADALAQASKELGEAARDLERKDALIEELASQIREDARHLQLAARVEQHSHDLARAHNDLQQQFQALKLHANWLEQESAALANRFGGGFRSLASAADFSAAQAGVDLFERELAWRQSEMRAARDEGGEILRAIVARSGLGRRLRGWEDGA